MTLRRLATAFALVVAVLLAAASPASAHATLESTSPADGSTVATAPTSVRLGFSESVTLTPSGVRVFDAAGRRVDDGNARHDGKDSTAVVGLKSGLADGTYVVSWRAVSADSHPVHGGFVFSIGAKSSVRAGLTASLTTNSGDKPWQVTAAVLRILGYVGVLLAGGAAAVLSAIGTDDDRRRLARPLTGAGALGALAVLAGLPVQATLASGLGIAAITKPGVLSQTLGEGVGLSVLATILGLAVVLVAVRRRTGPATRWLAWGGGAVAVGSFALAGHTRVTSPAWLVSLADLAHLGAGAVWFGGLVVLAVVLARLRGSAATADGTAQGDAGAAAYAVAKFSGIATVALVTVSIAGLTLGYVEVRALRALTSTTYGRLLLLKVAEVGLIALAGAYNHFRLVPVIESVEHDDQRWQALRRIVRAEAAGVVVVLALTGVLVNVTPARTAAGIGAVSSVTAPLGKGTINITVDPNRAGTNSIHIYLLDALGRQDDQTASLTLEFTQASHDIGPISRPAAKSGPGHWLYDGDALSLAGQWQITAIASQSEFDEERAVLTLKVNP